MYIVMYTSASLQPARKGRCYAIGVIVCLSEMSHLDIRHFKDFVFSHFTLIDTHLEQLKEGMEEALLTRAEPQRQNMLARAAQVTTLHMYIAYMYIIIFMCTCTCTCTLVPFGVSETTCICTTLQVPMIVDRWCHSTHQ